MPDPIEQLKQITRSADAVKSDEVPGRQHQDRVHQLAVELLDAVAAGSGTVIKSVMEYCDQQPLAGLELWDEALVLMKNEPSRWSLGSYAAMPMMFWSRYTKKVAELRGGTPRPTTTPTLRGGGLRAAAE
jgi:hypothetical protein